MGTQNKTINHPDQVEVIQYGYRAPVCRLATAANLRLLSRLIPLVHCLQEWSLLHTLRDLRLLGINSAIVALQAQQPHRYLYLARSQGDDALEALLDIVISFEKLPWGDDSPR